MISGWSPSDFFTGLAMDPLEKKAARGAALPV